MNASLTATETTNKLLELIVAQLSQIQTNLELNPRASNSPWVPLKEAATALHFCSTKALRIAIDRGRIPHQFVSATYGESGKRRTLYIDVQGFSAYLRSAQVMEFKPSKKINPVDWFDVLDIYSENETSTHNASSERAANNNEEAPI